MSMIFDFIKAAGETLGILDNDAQAAESAQAHVDKLGLGIEGFGVQMQGDKAVITGQASSQEAAEKAILAVGNIEGIAQVESQLQIAAATPEAQPQFYTVQSGDSLSKIAQEYYGDSNRYTEIFEANQPMLSNPDKIYPGQTLRIPSQKLAA